MHMLQVLAQELKIGNVKYQKQFVLWVENDTQNILKLLYILKEFPPLTSRLNLQVVFLEKMLKQKHMKTYLETRNSKYDSRVFIQRQIKENMKTIHYFGRWLSGFIEAEGCFSIRQN